MWRAGSLQVTDEIRRDGKRVCYPVSKIRRGLETSRTAVVGYAVLTSILVALISWALLDSAAHFKPQLMTTHPTAPHLWQLSLTHPR